MDIEIVLRRMDTLVRNKDREKLREFTLYWINEAMIMRGDENQNRYREVMSRNNINCITLLQENKRIV